MKNIYPSFETNDFNFNRGLIDWYEYPLLIIYLGIFFMLAYTLKKLFFKSNLGSVYYYPAMLVSVFSGIFICLIYNYYYVGGDTLAYYNDARLLHKVFWNNPSVGIDIFFSSPNTLRDEYTFIYYNFRFLRANDTFMMVRISFLLQFLTLNSFLATSAFFGFISFIASWSFFSMLAKWYKSVYKPIAFAVLFIPSVLVWGSGIFKDTICLILIYLLIRSIYKIVAFRRLDFRELIVVMVSLYLIVILKTYIALVILFSGAFLSIFTLIKRVNNVVAKTLVAPIILVFGVALFYKTFEIVGSSNRTGRYSVEKILRTAEITASYLHYLSERDQSSGYSLGRIDYTLDGLAAKAPAAINVTLFRPYLWEVKNPLMLLSAIESLLFLVLTFFVILKVGVINFWKTTFKNPLVATLLVYTLSFSFAIGISTFNFGTLVRYKIPILPFFLIYLILVYHLSSSKARKRIKA